MESDNAVPGLFHLADVESSHNGAACSGVNGRTLQQAQMQIVEVPVQQVMVTTTMAATSTNTHITATGNTVICNDSVPSLENVCMYVCMYVM